MTVEPYRRVLANPGVRALLLVGLVARIPVIATGLTLTLHVVNGMNLGFLQAGLVGAASTAGVAVGAPAAGRFVDRHGLRPVLVVTTAAQLVFWPSAAFLPYWPLAVGAFVAGVLSLPVFSVLRQCVAAAVPAEQRRTGFTLDSMLVEVSYMIGPAVAVSATAALSSGWTMVLVGLGLVGSGVALLVLDPPTRTDEERERDEAAVPRRQWLTPALLALLGVTLAATFVLAAAELSVVAVLKADSATRWTGLVIGLMALSSLVGGFLYGALPRGFSPLVMIGGIAALTVPLGLVGDWQWLCLALVPSGLLCAPALSATVDAVSRWVPTAARGEAMGLHGTALTLGIAVSGPVTGVIIDDWGTDWSFAVAGLGGLLIVALAVPVSRLPRTAVAAAGTA
ncbi:MFS transporter [Actinoallomurus bryophytorum]|uniref:Putative MFS family arabinose efflux permease n=1 Tax=Actinoallomurus bryophytorum TaxID=1490222 RepID=A0A543CUI9_9ACTN|nr:MFS transporter [Actinoallomurus bryophytorum]TQM00709.1 putative MFS family arabinose efflux permease [Actinoallomurus bryophytorum]